MDLIQRHAPPTQQPGRTRKLWTFEIRILVALSAVSRWFGVSLVHGSVSNRVRARYSGPRKAKFAETFAELLKHTHRK